MLTIHKEDLKRLAQIVQAETGNDVQERNFPMLESRIRTHLIKLGLDTMQNYWTHFSKNEASEREVLQSLMTTHYTFFFREYVHFEVLQKWIDSEGAQLKSRYEKTKKPVRVWSAACSRGQEVYSLAMYLENHLTEKIGVPYEIVGTDIDTDSIRYAKNGVYPIKEVNTIPHEYLNKFWKKGTGAVKEFAAIHPKLKSKVRFEVLNLLESKSWTEKTDFDVIFCRNVFIYFAADKVQSMALELAKRLDPCGLFISGTSEPLRFENWAMSSVGPSCYRPSSNPIQKASTTLASAPSPKLAEPGTSNSDHQKYKVLCVDDSPTIQVLMKKIFSHDALCECVDVAANGAEARKKLDSGRYDLITLDIHMPEVNGIEFLQRLYVRKSDPPVIMVSSVNRTDLDLATKAMSLGAFDYVEKPAMNSLQKSADEILTKAKMALRIGSNTQASTSTEFDASISQRIVVPDASQCLRIVMASNTSREQLGQIIRGQKNEYRSPALLILWHETQIGSRIEADLMNWTDKQIFTIRDGKPLLKPNSIYLANSEFAAQILSGLKTPSISLQVLDKQSFIKSPSLENSTIQILLDETLSEFKATFENQSGMKISDLTPAISFPSLSVEFFANLRKAAA